MCSSLLGCCGHWPYSCFGLLLHAAHDTEHVQHHQCQHDCQLRTCPPQLCLVLRCGELSVIEYGVHEPLATCRTDHASPYLLSAAAMDACGTAPAARRLAYLVDAYTLRVIDMLGSRNAAAGAASGDVALATITHDRRIDWLVRCPAWGLSKSAVCIVPYLHYDTVRSSLCQHLSQSLGTTGCSVYLLHTGAQHAREPPLVSRQAPSPVSVQPCVTDTKLPAGLLCLCAMGAWQ
jgi:hypothetical protein